MQSFISYCSFLKDCTKQNNKAIIFLGGEYEFVIFSEKGEEKLGRKTILRESY